MKKAFIKTIIFLFIIVEIFLFNSSFAKALRIPSPSRVAAELESRYHINTSSIQNMGESFNVSGDKTTAPEVNLFFNPSEPKVGQKITATALPMYFSNPQEQLYYTWYLVRKDCRNLTNNPSASVRDICDKDNDGRITVNDWKVEAMSLLARGDFEVESNTYASGDNDHDGYEASIGGNDKSSVSDSLKYCYVHDFQTGVNAEMDDGCNHLFPHTNGSGSTGDGSFGIDEEEFWGTNPHDSNTASNGNLDEANVAGLGQDKLSWTYLEGDKVGVVVEGTSMIPTKYDGASYMVMWALPNNDCSIGDEVTIENITCSGNKIPICVNTESGVDLTGSTDSNWCAYINETPACASSSPLCSVGTPACVDPQIPPLPPLPADGAIDSTNTCESLALESPTCLVTTSTPSGIVQTGSKSVTARGYSFSIPTTSIHINDCIDNNLVDPAEKKMEKLDVALSFTPENPVNDLSGDNMGDLLSINSSISNPSQDPSQIYYEWKISAGKNSSGSFTDITKRLNDDGFIGGKISGINNPRIGISLNLGNAYSSYFQDGIGYLKIKVTAKESIPGKIRKGSGEVIVRVNATGNKIKAYLTSSLDGKTLSKGILICNDTTTSDDKLAYYICPVVKNQILRLEVDKSSMSDLSWSVNGQKIICDSALSADCSLGNVIFLPILGTEGDELNVKMTAKNISTASDPNNGRSIEITKTLQIVRPYIKIISNDVDTFWPKLLGSYTDLDGKEYSDYSNSDFATYFGADASLTAEFHPTWLERTGILTSTWTLDGEEGTNAATPKVVDFTVVKNIGEVHNATFSSFYVATNEIRKVLMNYWGVTQTESSGELISSSVSGEVISTDAAGTLSLKSPEKFLASIISNIPGQTLFLLRTMLVMFALILVSGLALNFSPDFGKNKQ